MSCVCVCVKKREARGGQSRRSLRSIPLIIVAWQSLHKSHCWALTSWKGWFCLLSLRAQQSPPCVTCLLECRACLPLQQITMIDSDGPLLLLIAPLYTRLPSPWGKNRQRGPANLFKHDTDTNIYHWDKTHKAPVAYLVSPCPFLCSLPVSVLGSPLRCSRCSSQIRCGPTKYTTRNAILI